MKNLVFCLFVILPMTAQAAPQVSITDAAKSFLASLDASQRTMTVMDFVSDERENYHYTPRQRSGIPFKAMTAPQRTAATQLLEAVLSDQGKLKVTQIMSLESVLGEIERKPNNRNSENYYFSIFGTPGDPKGWGWRFEGHHISLNFSLVDGKKISLTPSFLGSNPAEVRTGSQLGLRILAAEEDLSRTLVNTLLADGKKSVLFSDQAPHEILTGEKREVTAFEPVGIAASEMSGAQRTALIHLISQYTGRYRKELADADMTKIEKAGIENIHFGWAGGTRTGEAYYYRIQGPTFLIECVNFQNNANHIHTVWRDFNGDFGRDLLAEHVRQDHTP